MEHNDPTTPPAVPAGSPAPSRLAHILRTIFFFAIGFAFTLATLRAAPSFWYVPAAVLLLISGFLWFRPRLGASFALPLTLALLFMMFTVKPWQWVNNRAEALAAIAVLLVAIAICLTTLYRRSGPSWTPFAIAIALLAVAFGVDRTFTNRVAIKTLQMSFVANGTDPLGDKAELNSLGFKPVVVFVKIPAAICYDQVYDEDLRKRLEKSTRPTVTVEYNEFTTWGRHMGYNIRSIDGTVFNNGMTVVKPNPEASGGSMLTTGVDEKQIFTNIETPADCPR